MAIDVCLDGRMECMIYGCFCCVAGAASLYDGNVSCQIVLDIVIQRDRMMLGIWTLPKEIMKGDNCDLTIFQ